MVYREGSKEGGSKRREMKRERHTVEGKEQGEGKDREGEEGVKEEMQ